MCTFTVIMSITKAFIISEYKKGKRFFKGLDFADIKDFDQLNLENTTFEECYFGVRFFR